LHCKLTHPLFIFLYIIISLSGCSQVILTDEESSYDTASLLPSVENSYVYFGYSVSMSNDYALVGAPQTDSGGLSNSGAAYIFERTDSNIWDDGTKIMASDKAEDDTFGESVSISGDYALIGSPKASPDSVSHAGAAYIYHRTDADGWDSETILKASDGTENDNFGCSVAIDGDYAVVGADGAMAAYVYYRTDADGWISESILSMSHSATVDNFGSALSISGDYIIVGANGEDGGTAYIFERTDTNTWDSGTKISETDTVTFGRSVAISGDYAVIGDEGSEAAYVYKREDGVWSSEAVLTAEDGISEDYFGYSVSISGENVLVGAYRNDVNTASETGAAYLFERTGTGSWDTGTKVTAPDSQRNEYDYFGKSVYLSTDYYITGAPNADVNGKSNGGRAFIEKQQ
jgi:uncharacterized protein YceK